MILFQQLCFLYLFERDTVPSSCVFVLLKSWLSRAANWTISVGHSQIKPICTHTTSLRDPIKKPFAKRNNPALEIQNEKRIPNGKHKLTKTKNVCELSNGLSTLPSDSMPLWFFWVGNRNAVNIKRNKEIGSCLIHNDAMCAPFSFRRYMYGKWRFPGLGKTKLEKKNVSCSLIPFHSSLYQKFMKFNQHIELKKLHSWANLKEIL